MIFMACFTPETLDKSRHLCYNIKVASEQHRIEGEARAEKLEKSLKNPLTNARRCGIINKLPSREGSENSTLKIEQCNQKETLEDSVFEGAKATEKHTSRRDEKSAHEVIASES